MFALHYFAYSYKQKLNMIYGFFNSNELKIFLGEIGQAKPES